MFNIDYKRLLVLLLPTFLRKPFVFGLLRAAIVPLETLHKRFSTNRQANNYRLSHNGQVCYLQAALNDNFKSGNGGKITLITVERVGEWLYAITESGERILLAGDESTEEIPVAYNELMLNTSQNDFVVSIPSDLYDTRLEEIKATVDKYKLISKCAIYMSQSN